MSAQRNSAFSKLFSPLSSCIARRTSDRGPRNAEVDASKREQLKAPRMSEVETAWRQRLPVAHSSSSHLVEDDGIRMKNISSQTQSTLFGKLPLELRQIIYEYALGGQTLKVEVMNPNHHKDEKSLFKMMVSPAAEPVLAFSRSCKLAYLESTEYVYKHNTFLFPTITTIFVFQRLIAPHSYHAIRSLTIQWNYYHMTLYFDFLDGFVPNNLEFWTATCSEIAKMRGLEHVRLDMLTNTPYVNAEDEDMMFGPVEVLKGIKRVEVYVSWEEHETLRLPGAEREWQFKITRGVKSLIEECGGFF